MSDAQQSKRDLKDVVSVFLSKADSSETASGVTLTKVSESPKRAETQVISFLSPFDEEETFALNILFPLVLESRFKKCFLATALPNAETLTFIRRFFCDVPLESRVALGEIQSVPLTENYSWIFWPDRKFFESLPPADTEDLASEEIRQSNELFVLDLIRSNVHGFEHSLKVIDQLVLVLRPKIEDLKNAYKIMKTCQYLNQGLETSIIFNACMKDEEVEKVFSRLTETISQFLMLSVRCLGAVPIETDPENFLERVGTNLNLAALFGTRSLKSKTKPVSLEQIRFLQRLRSLTE